MGSGETHRRPVPVTRFGHYPEPHQLSSHYLWTEPVFLLSYCQSGPYTLYPLGRQSQVP